MYRIQYWLRKYTFCFNDDKMEMKHKMGIFGTIMYKKKMELNVYIYLQYFSVFAFSYYYSPKDFFKIKKYYINQYIRT